MTAIKTRKVTAAALTLTELLDESLAELGDRSVLTISSKVVALCEGRVVPIEGTNPDELLAQEADFYLPASFSHYGFHFSIKHGTMVAMAGIDKSNGDGNYVLWPKDPQASANAVYQYLRERFDLQEVGVIIVDSTSRPLRLGASGTAIAFSGFQPLKSYVDQPDLFGRPFVFEHADLLSGLAAAAVLVMGEGAEQTPLAVLADLPFLTFRPTDPGQDDLATLNLTLQTDLFAPFLASAPWNRGHSSNA